MKINHPKKVSKEAILTHIASGPVSIYPLKDWKLLFSLFFLLIMITILFYAGWTEKDYVMFGVGIICLLFFGPAAFFVLKKMFSQQPSLIISAQGIDDQSSLLKCGFVPWSEISDYGVMEIGNQWFFGFNVKHPERFQSSVGWVEKLRKKNANLYQFEMQIPQSFISLNVEDLFWIVEQKLK